MGVVTSIVAAGVALAGAAGSAEASKRATSHQKKANKAQRQINRLKNAQSKRQFLRDFRAAQANVVSGAVAAGVDVESSATQGTLGSQLTQTEVALEEFKIEDALGGVITNQTNRAVNATAQSNTFAAVSSFASNFIAFPAAGSGTPKTPPTPPTPKIGRGA